MDPTLLSPAHERPLAPLTDRRLVVISGPSGVGKGTLAQKLFDTHPQTFSWTVSHTTRKPRPGEIEGETYFYVSFPEFSALVDQNAFVEHAFFCGNYYGTSKRTVTEQEAKGLVVVLDIDMQGVKQIKADPNIDARYVFISPPSLEVLEMRLRDRSTETEEEIQKRLAQAKTELDYAGNHGVYDKVIINDDLESAYKELEKFIFSMG
ncbi:hypothetical protein FQN54_009875 [Arachnomyces sp. PD_36]|nr:hypothetical protein FQN54_009875 [Arachnomyces sp. PD_36]